MYASNTDSQVAMKPTKGCWQEPAGTMNKMWLKEEAVQR